MATSSTPGPAATSGAEMMKTVKAECDKAPAGPKKDAARSGGDRHLPLTRL